MSTFTDTRLALKNAKAKSEGLEAACYALHQGKLLLEQDIAQTLRERQLAALPATDPQAKSLAELAANLAARRTELATAAADTEKKRQALDALGVPQRIATEMDAGFPFLLLPLRLQTRFRVTKFFARNCPAELCLDISAIPIQFRNHIRAQISNVMDTPAGPSFYTANAYEVPLLSKKPSAAQLVDTLSGIGSKRWKKQEDQIELMLRIFPDDIFVQTHEAALTPQERDAGNAFWAEMKKESSNTEARVAAWRLLQSAFKTERAAWVARSTMPADFTDGSMDTSLRPAAPPTLKSTAWTLPARTDVLPDRFVVRLVFPDGHEKEATGLPVPLSLVLGIDPDQADDPALMTAQGDRLTLPPAIRWLTDFDAAVQLGMALSIPLTPAEYASGIKQVLVLGIKASADPDESRLLLEKLLDNHHYKPHSMALLPQGTPTNNLPGQPAGFSSETPDARKSFDLEWGQPQFPASGPAHRDQPDGLRLSRMLGIAPGPLQHIQHAGKQGGSEALRMNRALWDGTLGYYLDHWLRPAVNDDDVAFVKEMCSDFVTARGLLPAFRAGKQPYGIVPATAWSRWQPGADAPAPRLRMAAALAKLNADWSGFAKQTSNLNAINKNTTAEAWNTGFRSLLTLQAGSTDYFRKLVAGELLIWNMAERINKEFGQSQNLAIPLVSFGSLHLPDRYFQDLGNTHWKGVLPQKTFALKKFIANVQDFLFRYDDDPLKGDFPDQNFLFDLRSKTIEELVSASTLEQLKKLVPEAANSPLMLLLHLAHFALLRSYLNAATEFYNKKIGINTLARADFEEEILDNGDTGAFAADHAALFTNTSGKKLLKKKLAYFNESLEGKTISNLIKSLLSTKPSDSKVAATVAALEALEALGKVPMERLELLLAEHLDLCSYRLDAWMQALPLEQLHRQRATAGYERGIFLGAYGYLENLKPAARPWSVATEVKLPQVVNVAAATKKSDLVMPIFNFGGYTAAQKVKATANGIVYLGSAEQTSLFLNPKTNQIEPAATGSAAVPPSYLLAPSLEHATTAALLRSAYEHHRYLSGSPASKALAVNMDSARTGVALELLKEMQVGHSLTEQIGYRIERAMYQNLALADDVPKVRNKFPLYIEVKEWGGTGKRPKNLTLITDGLALLNGKRRNSPEYIALGLSAAEKTAFEKILRDAEAAFDSVGDLLLAESVFQIVKGSPEKAAAALRVLGEGGDVRLPEIVDIPLEGNVVAHRLALVLNAGGNAQARPGAASPAATAAPEVNRWLAAQLPDPKKIFATATPENAAARKIALSDLGIQPLDLLYLLKGNGKQPDSGSLAHLLREKARQTAPVLPPETPIDIHFQRTAAFAPGEFSVSQILAQCTCTHEMLAASRPMRPKDWLPERLRSDSDTTNAAALDNTALLALVNNLLAPLAAPPAAPHAHSIRAFLKRLQDAAQGLAAVETGTAATAAFAQLYALTGDAMRRGCWDAAPQGSAEFSLANRAALLAQAEGLIKKIQGQIAQAEAVVVPKTGSGAAFKEEQFAALAQVVQVFLGEKFPILPVYALPNAAEVLGSAADSGLLTNAGEFAAEEWLQGVATVRDNAARYQLLAGLREARGEATAPLKILQLPFVPGGPNHWAGGKLPAGYTVPPDVVSMAMEPVQALAAGQRVAGLLLDAWREQIPVSRVTGGLTMQYDQPGSEPPQTLLLAVSPQRRATWAWEDLADTVLETIEMARKRAVEPGQIQNSYLGQFLPALVAPIEGAATKNTVTLDFNLTKPKTS